MFWSTYCPNRQSIEKKSYCGTRMKKHCIYTYLLTTFFYVFNPYKKRAVRGLVTFAPLSLVYFLSAPYPQRRVLTLKNVNERSGEKRLIKHHKHVLGSSSRACCRCAATPLRLHISGTWRQWKSVWLWFWHWAEYSSPLTSDSTETPCSSPEFRSEQQWRNICLLHTLQSVFYCMKQSKYFGCTS